MHMKLVLRRIQQEIFLTNLKKCSSMKRELVLLGSVISKECIKVDPDKVKAIVKCPSPSNI